MVQAGRSRCALRSGGLAVRPQQSLHAQMQHPSAPSRKSRTSRGRRACDRSSPRSVGSRRRGCRTPAVPDCVEAVDLQRLPAWPSHHAKSVSGGQAQACSSPARRRCPDRRGSVGQPSVAPAHRQGAIVLRLSAEDRRTPRSVDRVLGVASPSRVLAPPRQLGGVSDAAGPLQPWRSATGTRWSAASVPRNESCTCRWISRPASCSQPRVAYEVSDGV